MLTKWDFIVSVVFGAIVGITAVAVMLKLGFAS
jgi:hypothetical protein